MQEKKILIDRRIWLVVIACLFLQVIYIAYLHQSAFWIFHAADVEHSVTAIQLQTFGQHNKKSSDDYTLASYESFGFFQNVPESEWRLKQKIAISTPHHLDPDHDKVSDFFYRPRGWYQNNWEPDFSCDYLQFLGPIRDGHKWTCDPNRLKEQKEDCLVYSFGSNGNFDFESAVLEVAPQCEIHVFDPGMYGTKMKRALKNANAHYHTFGMKPSYETDPALTLNKELPQGVFKTFQEVIQELGHSGRTVSLFKIDIEGGEWATFRDWLDADVLLQQILVEVHDAPPIANTFFAELHKAGYAMFHKEPNIQFAGGDAVEFGFIKLRPSFFAGDTMPSDHSQQALSHAKTFKEEYKSNRAKDEYDYGREMRATGVI